MSKKQKKRNIGRRDIDFSIRKQNDRYSKLCEVGKTITSEINLEELFPLVMDLTNKIMGSERSSVFLYDKKADELWSLVATGMEGNKIRIPANSGLAGWVFKKKQSLVVNDVYNDSRFNIGVDCNSGFKTKNILCVPLINSHGECIGVLQTLNRKKGEFSHSDNTFLTAISDYVAIALDNARLYNDINKYSRDLQKQVILNESLIKIKDSLRKFVPKSVANLAETDPDKLSGEKVPMQVSVLFVDLQNFSSISENHEQRIVNHMVENHFSSYLKCIYNHDGELNETSGDGIMVIFKDDAIEESAIKAVRAALEIIDANKRINIDYNYPWGKIDLHLGISSGEAYVGITRMKSRIGERWTYTASGFVTVLASRIGSLSKKSRLYIGENTYKLTHDKLESKLVGSFKLKNVSEKMSIHRVTKVIS